MSNKINKILKATENFELFMIKKTAEPVTIGVILTTALAIYGALALSSGFVSAAMERIRSTKNVIEDTDVIIKKLTEYKEDYQDEDWFKSFSKNYDKFLESANELKSSGEIIVKSIESQKADESLIPTLQRFLQSLSEVERLSPAIDGFLESNKSWGKALDTAKSLGVGFGIETDAIAVQTALGSLYRHASYEKIKYEDLIKEMIEKLKIKSKEKGKAEPGKSPEPTNKEEEISEDILPKNNSNQKSSLEDFADILV